MEDKLKRITELCQELEELEKKAKNTKIPKDWFWTKGSLDAVRSVVSASSLEIKKISQEYGTTQDLKNIEENLESLLQDLNKAHHSNLTPEKIEKFRKETEWKLHSLDYHLAKLLLRLNIIKKSYSSDPLAKKKKILLEIGLNIYRYPEWTQMLLADWSIVEELLRNFKAASGQMSHYEALWGTLPLFNYLIFQELSSEEITSLRKSIVGDRTSDEIYQNPNFAEELHQFQHEVTLRKISLDQQKAANLKYVLLSLSMIVLGGTVGEHLGARVVETVIPNLKNYLKNQEDLLFSHPLLKKSFQIDCGMPCRVAELLNCFQNSRDGSDYTITNWKKIVQSSVELVKEDGGSWVVYLTFNDLVELIIHHQISLEQAVAGIAKLLANHWEYDHSYNNFSKYQSVITSKKATFNEIVDVLILLTKKRLIDKWGIFFSQANTMIFDETTFTELLTQFLRLADKVSKENLSHLAQQSLPVAKHLIYEHRLTLSLAVTGFLQVEKQLSQEQAKAAFEYGFPAVDEGLLSGSISWTQAIVFIIKIARESPLLKIGHSVFPAVGYYKHISPQSGISQEEYIDGIINIAKQTGELSASVYRLLPIVLPLVDFFSWSSFTEFLGDIGKSKQKTNQAVSVLTNLNPKTYPFLNYLIVYRPRQVLDIFGKYRLLQSLEIQYEQELDLFLQLAYPLTMKGTDSSRKEATENRLSGLIAVISPLGKINSTQRAKYLKILNNCLTTFEGVSTSFLKSLQATEGFEHPEEFSFAEMVYIYLKYSDNPELKLKNLKKSLDRIGKDEAKLLKLVADKAGFGFLNPTEREVVKSTLKDLSTTFFEPLMSLFTRSAEESTQRKLELMFKTKVKKASEKVGNESFLNALTLLKRLEKEMIEKEKNKMYALCFNLIQNYLEDNTYPRNKDLIKSYPWNLLPNSGWCKLHLKNQGWYEDFRQEYFLTAEHLGASNIEERMQHHFLVIQALLKEMGIEFPGQDIDKLIGVQKSIHKDKSKYPIDKVRELNDDLNALMSLAGRQTQVKTGKKIIILPEFDPLEILQMGNYVVGSCLNVNGSNYWSAVVNASEVNKRTLWAKDEAGNVLARLLIAVDEDNKLVRFPIYYTTDFSLEQFFNDYLIKLAEKCNLGVNGNKNKVKTLLAKTWYSDKDVPISLPNNRERIKKVSGSQM